MGSSTYVEVIASLRRAYNRSASERDRRSAQKEEWKQAERAAFLARLRAEGQGALLEIGAGTGQDSLFFRNHGLDVTATDLSPAMVERCREKGLKAFAMDFLALDFPDASFDALYAMNCLLHVPNAELPTVLGRLARLLRPGGLFYLGVYGGKDDEGIQADDWHDPPRFFSWRSDEQILAFAREHFGVEAFHILNEGTTRRFQSLTLRRVTRPTGEQQEVRL